MEARRGIPHHLIDVFDPVNDFSAGEFFHAARAATADILSRGRTPIVVGGTGFYLRWYLLGKPSTPSSSKESEAAATAKLEEAWAAAAAAAGRPLTDAERWAEGVGVVAALGDAESAARLSTETNNYYRLTRVVDILMQSPGKTLADLNLDEAAPMDYDFRCFFLARPRTILYRRIDSRVEEMVAGGLLPETARELAAAGLRPNTNCATRAIGYRQALEFLERKAGEKRENSEDEKQTGAAVTEAEIVTLSKEIMAASRKLCHRQMSWFRDDPLFRWVDAAAGEAAVVDTIMDGWTAAVHQGGAGPEFNGGRLTKEEQGQMKRYVSKLERLTKGSEALVAAVAQAEEALAVMAEAAERGDAATDAAEGEPQAKRSRVDGVEGE